ncbi:homeobox protein MSX-2 isoform X1 [Amyelois transitella]|uniref:homeobox protein MSX-2 isoform X1 n=1 Tax=Amyelois transitella TaxID=680683 RepID=UPI0029901C7D|nr:homeobox protein MSX-2 isoform X1 [Amyelois transitella]
MAKNSRSTSSACRARRSGRHARVPFTAAQAAALEAAYARAPYLAPPALRALAAALQLRDDRIKIWFQNRRARERREKTTTIAPPSSVTLPATPRVHPPQTRWIPYTNTIHSTPRDFLTDNSTHEDAAIDSGMAYDLTVTPLPFHSQSRSPSNDSERSETPLDIESIDE